SANACSRRSLRSCRWSRRRPSRSASDPPRRPNCEIPMNPALELLHPYPFEKLRGLLAGAQPPAGKPAISLSIGEPKHPAPAFVAQALADNLEQLSTYPTTLGVPALRESIVSWCERRFSVPAGWLDPASHVLPVNGTREALFAFTQAVVDRNRDGL